MSVNIDVHTFKNFSGSGKEQKFVSIQQGKPLTRRKIEELLQARCTITRADAEAVFTALADLAKEQLSMGNRFYIPEIGYLSLVANVDLPQNIPMEKVKGNYVSVKNIKFRAEKEFLEKVQSETHFNRSKFTSKSMEYSEEEMKEKVLSTLKTDEFINLRSMEVNFNLSPYMSRKWIAHFVETGLLVKKGTNKHPLYYLRKD